jgi:choline dehydrogenase-like flavoprotein
LFWGKDLESAIGSFKLGNKIIGKINEYGSLTDEEGKSLGMHIQETPFLCWYSWLTEMSHYYQTTPQIHGQKREIVYPRGNVIGGSSATNTMVYFRGSKFDYEHWENDLGLKGWGYTSVMPYFKKFENNIDVPNKPDVHGYNGPIHITISKKHAPIEAGDAWTQGALKLGWPKIEDSSNPETQYGASDSWQTFVDENGKRSDTSAFIREKDMEGRVCWDKTKDKCDPKQRLHIWTYKFATKILLDDNKRAFGVEYVNSDEVTASSRSENVHYDADYDEGAKHHYSFSKWNKFDVQQKIKTLGAPVHKELALDYDDLEGQYIPKKKDISPFAKRVTAKYEVILSAGAVGTAQLLMLSGIGPAEHLREKSVPLVADLPVGQHMQDHQEVEMLYKFPKEYDPGFDWKTEALKGFPNVRSHLKGERTVLSTNGVIAGVEGSSRGPKDSIKKPTWHMHHVIMGPLESFDANLCLDDETCTPPYRYPRSMTEMFSWRGLHVHTHICELSGNHAIGKIELRSNDPMATPFLDMRYGASDEDNAELVDCAKTVREIMKNSDAKFVGEEYGRCSKAITDEQLTQCVRNTVWGHHISGTAPMGNCTTPYAVTDERGRVYKVSGIRVSDISLMPTLPHGNPAAVVMMMAEKVSDMIKEDYGVHVTLKDEL